MNTRAIEDRLIEQLRRDRAHPSRQHFDGDVTIVSPSGTAVGLAIAISDRTGEDTNDIMNRVMEGVA